MLPKIAENEHFYCLEAAILSLPEAVRLNANVFPTFPENKILQRNVHLVSFSICWSTSSASYWTSSSSVSSFQWLTIFTKKVILLLRCLWESAKLCWTFTQLHDPFLLVNPPQIAFQVVTPPPMSPPLTCHSPTKVSLPPCDLSPPSNVSSLFPALRPTLEFCSFIAIKISSVQFSRQTAAGPSGFCTAKHVIEVTYFYFYIFVFRQWTLHGEHVQILSWVSFWKYPARCLQWSKSEAVRSIFAWFQVENSWVLSATSQASVHHQSLTTCLKHFKVASSQIRNIFSW